VDILWPAVATMTIKIHNMAKKELFEKGPIRWIMNKLNAFPAARQTPGPSVIKIPRILLKKETVVGIFPSGTRTSEEVPLKRGAVTIAGHAKVPIVPAAYVGPNSFGDLFKRVKPCLIYGEPIYLPEGMKKKEAMEVMMEQLNNELH